MNRVVGSLGGLYKLHCVSPSRGCTRTFEPRRRADVTGRGARTTGARRDALPTDQHSPVKTHDLIRSLDAQSVDSIAYARVIAVW
jgi:hypothetical protein